MLEAEYRPILDRLKKLLPEKAPEPDWGHGGCSLDWYATDHVVRLAERAKELEQQAKRPRHRARQEVAMLIAIGRDERDRPLLVLGLEEGNLERLRKGQPIFRDMAEFGRPDLGTLLIVWGPTAAEIETELRAATPCPPARTYREPEAS